MAARLETLRYVTVLIGDTNAKRAAQLADGLRDESFGRTLIVASLEQAKTKLESEDVDVVILCDTLGGALFQFIRDIRHARIGHNPFVTILCALAPEHVDGAKKALLTGVDNILLHPVPSVDVADRVRMISRSETMYAVTSEFIGPDRSAGERSSIRRFVVPQTLTDKIQGKTKTDHEEFAKKIRPLVQDMLETRLVMQGSRLTTITEELVDAYATKEVTPTLKEKMIMMREIFKEAKPIAAQLAQNDLAGLYSRLGKQILDFSERYTQPTEKDMDLISELREQFGAFAKVGDDESLESIDEDLDEPALEIQFITKGQTLFNAGDPADTAYVVAAGCVGIFQNVDGKNKPLQRINEGEFFGEMAILDGSPRSTTAIALEDTTLSLVSKQSLNEKMEASDVLIRTILQTSIYSLRKANENYTQKARSLPDILGAIGFSRHVFGKYTERFEIKEEEGIGDLLKAFDVKYAEIVKAFASTISKGKR